MLYFLPLLLSLILSILPVHGFAYSHNRFHKNPVRLAPRDFRDYHHIVRRNDSTAATGFSGASGASSGIIASTTPYQNYTFSNSLRASSTTDTPISPSLAVSATTTASGATTMVTTVPAYSVFDSAASTYSTVFATRTTTACDATLTGFFTRVTVTDCNQKVTFSTKSSFYLVATTPSAALAARQAVTTSVQSVVSYYVAPWQSIAANTPNDITIVVCTISATGVQTCSSVQEVWATVTTYVPVTSTATLTVSQYFKNNALIMVGGQNIAVNSGAQQFSTVIVYTTMTPSAMITASQLAASPAGLSTRTTTMRSTVEQMGNMVTVTAVGAAAAASSATNSSSIEPTTTITQTVQKTLTMTLARQSSSSFTTLPYFTNSSSTSTGSVTMSLV